jgi:hypothetical protein
MFSKILFARVFPPLLLLCGITGLPTTAQSDNLLPPSMQRLIDHAKALAATPYYPPVHIQQPVPDTVQKYEGPGQPTIVYRQSAPP